MSTDYCATIFDEDKGVNDVVSEFIRTALTTFETKVDDIFLSTLDVPFATELAMLKIQKVIDLAMLEHDGNSTFEDEPLEVLTPDGEPMPSTIDSWARGTVAVKKVAADEHHGIPHSFNNDTPSLSSGYTGRSSGTGKASSRASSRGTARTNGGTGRLQDADVTGKIIELDEDVDGDFAGLGSTGFMFDMLQKSKRKKDQGFAEKDAEKGEFALLQEQMDQAKKDLRGKKFVLDRYGKPVVVGSVNAEKLTPFSTPLGLNIKGNGPDMDLDNMSTGSSVMDAHRKNSQTSVGSKSGGPNQPKKKQFVRVAGSRGVEESSFKPTLSLAVTLSGVEHIPKLQPGVSVRSSTSVRSGEKVAEDPKHMSRSKYMSQSLSRRSVAGENSTIDSMSRTLDASSMYTTDQRVGGGSVFSGASRTIAGRSQASNGRPTGGGTVTTMRSIDNIPDMDRFEGARPVVGSNLTPYDMSDEELGLGPVNTRGAVPNNNLPGKVTAKQKANIELLAGGADNGRPKDRDLPKNMRPVTERKHLPAPPLGHITGHGLSVEKFNEKSKLLEKEEENWHQDWRA